MKHHRAGWALVIAMVVTAHAAPLEGGQSTDTALLGEAESAPTHVLHAQNQDLLQQIEGLQGGASAQPAAPAPMAGMMAMGAGPPEGNLRLEGIKEALTAVKPIMDKYVNTAKTLTGKYSALKQEYQKLQEAKGGVDPKAREAMSAQIKKTKAEDAAKYSALKGQYQDLENKEAAERAAGMSEETGLKEANAKAVATNEAVANSFMTELETARKAAKGQIANMRRELNRFMTESNQEQFDAVGKATAKAIEEKKTLSLKAPEIKSQVKRMLQNEAKVEKAQPGY